MIVQMWKVTWFTHLCSFFKNIETIFDDFAREKCYIQYKRTHSI